MTKPNDVLSPSIAILEGDIVTCRQGLTKREYFAAMAMQGLLQGGISTLMAAEFSVKAADALINELNKENP